MSSNAGSASRFFTPAKLRGWIVAGSLGLASPLGAQTMEADSDDGVTADDDNAAETAQATNRRNQFEGVELSITVPKNPSDALLEEDCEKEADAARIANEIVVCRQLGEATDGSFDSEEWKKRYAERTQGEKPVDVDGTGLRAPDGSRMKSLVGTGFGGAPPPALLIDVEALPQAPAGSDADRIARGLPPLGEDELTPEEIAERRRQLGLEPPPARTAPK